MLGKATFLPCVFVWETFVLLTFQLVFLCFYWILDFVHFANVYTHRQRLGYSQFVSSCTSPTIFFPAYFSLIFSLFRTVFKHNSQSVGRYIFACMCVHTFADFFLLFLYLRILQTLPMEWVIWKSTWSSACFLGIKTDECIYIYVNKFNLNRLSFDHKKWHLDIIEYWTFFGVIWSE